MTLPALVEATGIGKIFGSLRALDSVDFTLRPGTFHAVIGENGAGKSTLAKCLLGFYHADDGEVRMDGVRVHTPAEARQAGMGMVFQHFTLVPSMTVAENLVLAKQDLPPVLNWREERKELEQFLQSAPFQVDLDSRVMHLAAGQKQKVEILKQLYLKTSVLLLDEPTSVLTPSESDEVMGVLRGMVQMGALSVVLITHKLREVMKFADEVTVLRRGRFVACKPVSATSPDQLASLMMGGSRPPQEAKKADPPRGGTALEIQGLTARGDNGLIAVNNVSLRVASGEILGVAGVSGNGQRELIQAIGGQRPIESGEIRVDGTRFHPTREGIRQAALFTLPEEPLPNATVPRMSVAENIALRTFDQAPVAKGGFLLDRSALLRMAREAIQKFSVRPTDPTLPIRNLSGGNVQRAVLARDLGGGEARIMVVSNPCFGLDFGATAFVHNHLIEVRNRGGSVLLASEDLDELTKLADRIVVMSGGAIIHETTRAEADLAVIGRFMGGHAA